MSTPKEKALDRARKLNAIAVDQAGTPEGDTASSLVQALCGKWGFTPEDLIQEIQDGPVLFRAIVEFGEPRLQARAYLLNAIATIGDCLSSFRLREVPVGPNPPPEHTGEWFARVFGEDEDRVALVVSVFGDVEQWLSRRLEASRDFTEMKRALDRIEAGKGIGAGTKNLVHLPPILRQRLIDHRRNWWMTAAVELIRIWRDRTVQDEGEGGELKAADWQEKAPETALAVTAGGAKDALAKKTNKAEQEPWQFDWTAAQAIQEFAEAWPFADPDPEASGPKAPDPEASAG